MTIVERTDEPRSKAAVTGKTTQVRKKKNPRSKIHIVKIYAGDYNCDGRMVSESIFGTYEKASWDYECLRDFVGKQIIQAHRDAKITFEERGNLTGNRLLQFSVNGKVEKSIIIYSTDMK